MSPLKFSIVIPNFNQGDFIEEAICSVLEQDYPYKELLVFDAASADQSVEILKKYDEHITYWESAKDQGQSHAINKGLRKISGNVFNWLNADDKYLPGTFSAVAAAFEENKVNLVAGKMNHVSGGKVIDVKETQIDNGNLSKSIGMYHMYQPAMFFRREVVDRLGPLNEKLHFVMDREWWVKYLGFYGFGALKQINRPLVDFRLHEGSKTIEGSFEKFYRDAATLYAKLSSALGDETLEELMLESNHLIKEADAIDTSDYSDEQRQIFKDAIPYFCIELANYFYFHQDRRMAKRILELIDIDKLDQEGKTLLLRLKLKTANRAFSFVYSQVFRKL